MKDSHRPHVLHVIPEDWFFWSHRRALAKAAIAAGYRVSVATRVSSHGARIEALGVRVLPLTGDRASRNPFKELAALFELGKLYRRERPDIVHHTAIKPVLYGSLAAAFTGVDSVVNAIPGLGHVYVARGWKAAIVRSLVSVAYRCALSANRGRTRVVFENPDDCARFVSSGIVESAAAQVVLGMGCDTEEFDLSEEPTGVPVVMYAGRMLWSKGVGDLVAAVEQLRGAGVTCRLVLVGDGDSGNPQSISREVLSAWSSSGKAEWWGRRDDMSNILAQANLLVLPSRYGEGLPKVLMEGAASGRALVATNIPGCREIVRDGVTGLLVEVGNVSALAGAIGHLLSQPQLRRAMGAAGRDLVLARFSDVHVNRETLRVYSMLLEVR